MAASRRTWWRTTCTSGFEVDQSLGGAVDLGPPDRGRGVQHLALQVRGVDDVVVHHAQVPDTGSGQVEQHGAAEAAGPDHQDPGGGEAALTLDPDAGQHGVTGVAGGCGTGQGRARRDQRGPIR